MPRQKAAAKVDALARQQADLIARLKEAKRVAKAEEKETLRRKAELAGAAVLQELTEHPGSAFAAAAYDFLQNALVRPVDRALFGFQPRTVVPEGGERAGRQP